MFKPLCLLLLLCSAPGAFGAAASAGDYDGDGAPTNLILGQLILPPL